MNINESDTWERHSLREDPLNYEWWSPLVGRILKIFYFPTKWIAIWMFFNAVNIFNYVNIVIILNPTHLHSCIQGIWWMTRINSYSKMRRIKNTVLPPRNTGNPVCTELGDSWWLCGEHVRNMSSSVIFCPYWRHGLVWSLCIFPGCHF
jgi:hypothetical protein